MEWPHLKRLKKMMGHIPASARQVEKKAYVYHEGGDLRGNLMQAQGNFARVVQAAGDGSVQEVKDEEFRTLSEFTRKVDSDTFAHNERLASDLRKVEALALKLYKGEVSQGVEKQWKEFISKWRPILGNRFPFGGSNTPGSLEYPTASSADLAEFFFGSDGLDSFIKEHELLSEKSGRALENNRKNFLRRCLAWKKFLFNQGRQPRIHSVRTTLTRSLGPLLLSSDEKDAGKWFTNLDIDGLPTSKNMDRLRLRFSGEKYRNGHVRWSTDDPIDKLITINAYDQGQSGRTASVTISGGDLFLPAFVKSSAGKSGLVKIRMPDGGDQYFATALKFRWDENIPPLIGWVN